MSLTTDSVGRLILLAYISPLTRRSGVDVTGAPPGCRNLRRHGRLGGRHSTRIYDHRQRQTGRIDGRLERLRGRALNYSVAKPT